MIPLNLAHRGASGYAPENTLSAIHLAQEMGADGVEIDVHLTADDHVVLLHDDTLDRTSTGLGAVQEKELTAVQKLDAGSWFSASFAGETIATLQQALTCGQDRLYFNIEIKWSPTVARLAAAVADILHRLLPSGLAVTSFDASALMEMKRLAPEIPLGLIFEGQTVDPASCPWPILSADFHLVDRVFVQSCHASHKKLYVWTVNEIADMERMIELGVDAVMTNYPDHMAEAIKHCIMAK